MAKAKPKLKQARTRSNILKKLKQIWKNQSILSTLINKLK
jgi:hypothetical protein